VLEVPAATVAERKLFASIVESVSDVEVSVDPPATGMIATVRGVFVALVIDAVPSAAS